MAETPKYLVQNVLGCGFVGAIFQRGGFKPRKTSAPPLPAIRNTNSAKYSTSYNCRRRRGSSGELSFLQSSKSAKPPPPKPGKIPITSLHQIHGRKHSDAARCSDSFSKKSSLNRVSQKTDLSYTRKLKKEPTFTESELRMRIANRQKSSESGMLYRASSGNAMLLGHLGNLKQNNVKTLDYHLRNTQKKETSMGKIGRNHQLGNIYRSSTNKLDSEVLKSMGNEKYKQGRFEEALALYNQAIALDSSNASYYSNKSAALIGLGRLIEAVFECKVAIRIEPFYHRAHHRLAKLYLRLGEAEKSMSHYKQSGPKADTRDTALAQVLKTLLNRCNEARKLGDWNTLLKESQSALSLGADSAPQIYAMQAEALLNLHRHQEAYSTIQKGPSFDIHHYSQFFGSAGTANLLTIRAQIYMAAGRFEDAVSAAQRAAQLDPCNEVDTVADRARALASARSNGNKLFKASKFWEACAVYSEGLEYEPYNSVLLCNRAAGRAKLGQFEKAVEDCTAALNVRPSYTKARLRRAGCYAKLERWEAAVQDYEVSIQETPGVEDVDRALYEAQVHLKKRRSEDINNMKFGSNLVQISSKEHFKHFIIAPGMSVVLFCNKTCDNHLLQLTERLCKRFPSVNFLKVVIEDLPSIAKLEDVNCIPAFKIYKNGSTIKEISGDEYELLESSVELISSTAAN